MNEVRSDTESIKGISFKCGNCSLYFLQFVFLLAAQDEWDRQIPWENDDKEFFALIAIVQPGCELEKQRGRRYYIALMEYELSLGIAFFSNQIIISKYKKERIYAGQ
jgi:hypothetical protein